MDKAKQKENEELSQPMAYLFMGIMLITGSINTRANKVQQSTESLGFPYETHQKFVTFCMFWGETICLAIQRCRKKKKSALPPLLPEVTSPLVNQQAEDKEKQVEHKDDNTNQPKVWYFLFPALFDLCGSSIMSMSLTFLAPSIYQMFRGAVIIFTASASLVFLKSKLHRHHLVGISIVVIGLIVVGLKAVLAQNGKGAGTKPVLGIILIISGQLFSAAMFITEEKLLKSYHSNRNGRMLGSWFIYYIAFCIL